jgi:formate dehydrogenase major subunit/formate dehydrogenase alpha subunit
MFGAGAMTNSIDEIRGTDLMFVIGSNTTEAHPIIAMEMKRAVRRGAKLIVADPRAIWMSRIADIHLQLKPGTDVALLNAMAHVIISEGLIDRDFIAKHTEDFDRVAGAVRECTPEWAETLTTVPAADIRTAARWYATTKRAGIYYTLGVTEHTHGTDNVYGLANLVAMTGHLGRRHAGMNPLRGQNNVQGANDSGATPIFLPGYQRVTDAAIREKFEKAWGVPLPAEEGLNLNVMMKSMSKGIIKGLYVIGEDLVLSEPNATSIEAGLNQCEFIAMQDILPNEMLRFADVILPAACFAEKDGVFTNSDRRVQRVRKAVEPPGEARPDWEIICDVARAVGYPMPRYAHPREIYAEMASLVPNYSGISHERIDGTGGLQWPCTSPDHPGTPTLHASGPMRGKVSFQPIAYRPSAELPDGEYPLILSTGRTLYHYNAGTMTTRSAGASIRQAGNFIEMHRKDAARRRIADGEEVRVVSRRGSVVARVNVSPRVRRGCIWMPLHFAESNVNRLTNDAGDTITGTAEYKVCAVEVEPLSACAGCGPSSTP